MIKHILSCQCMWKRFPLFWNALKLQANHQPKMYRVQIICHQIMRQRHTQHVISTNEKKDDADSRLDFSFDIIHLLIFDKKAHLILLNEILLIWMAYNLIISLDIWTLFQYVLTITFEKKANLTLGYSPLYYFFEWKVLWRK